METSCATYKSIPSMSMLLLEYKRKGCFCMWTQSPCLKADQLTVCSLQFAAQHLMIFMAANLNTYSQIHDNNFGGSFTQDLFNLWIDLLFSLVEDRSLHQYGNCQHVLQRYFTGFTSNLRSSRPHILLHYQYRFSVQKSPGVKT